MIKRIAWFFFAVTTLAMPLEVTFAQDNYVVPAVVYTAADDDRLVDNEIGGGQISVGRFLTDRFAIEALLGSSGLSGTDDLDLTELGLNARWVFRRDMQLSPYLLAGFGFFNEDSEIFSGGRTSYQNIGAGLEWGFGESPFAMRLEHRVRGSNGGSSDLTDQITSLGLSYAFGKESTPMPIPPAADPDSDGDGVPDSRDACPDTPAGYPVNGQGCALDSDQDGVIDAVDECPDTYRGADVDARGCERDDDNDGVVNRLDDCPNSPAGARVDVNGCEIKDVIELPGVNFETNSDRLLPGADGVLRDAAATLQKYPELVVEVAGHTDSVGGADYNQGLSERRAYTVRDYLVNAGANEDNLSAKGYGEAAPVADNETAEGRAENRRVELRIIEK